LRSTDLGPASSICERDFIHSRFNPSRESKALYIEKGSLEFSNPRGMGDNGIVRPIGIIVKQGWREGRDSNIS
jgi:hypothetical protein